MAEYERQRAYRERLRQSGKKQVLVALPLETLEVLETIQTEKGYANRSETIDALVRSEVEAFRRIVRA